MEEWMRWGVGSIEQGNYSSTMGRRKNIRLYMMRPSSAFQWLRYAGPFGLMEVKAHNAHTHTHADHEV